MNLKVGDRVKTLPGWAVNEAYHNQWGTITAVYGRIGEDLSKMFIDVRLDIGCTLDGITANRVKKLSHEQLITRFKEIFLS